MHTSCTPARCAGGFTSFDKGEEVREFSSSKQNGRDRKRRRKEALQKEIQQGGAERPNSVLQRSHAHCSVYIHLCTACMQHASLRLPMTRKTNETEKKSG